MTGASPVTTMPRSVATTSSVVTGLAPIMMLCTLDISCIEELQS
jgi:hypothetical protein